MTADSVLDRWQGAELIPLPELASALEMGRGALHYAVKSGVITPSERKGPNGRHLITWAEAAILVAAAVLAASLGLAIVTALRGLKASGAVAAPSGVMIPLLGVAA